MNQLTNYPHLKWYVSNLRAIPGGKFRWGASPSQKKSGIEITQSPFRMGATPVTWGMWKEYRESLAVPGQGIKYLGRNDHPVENVSWEDIMNPGGFCEWASKNAGFKLTLPTDAQWEYAARGGKDGLEYPWGNKFDKSCLWCSDMRPIDAQTSAAVDRSDRIYRNGYGLTDMVGNISQLCLDYFNEDYRPIGKDPIDTRMNERRCSRGGTWSFNDPVFFRCAFRGLEFQFSRSIAAGGFRLAAGPV